MYFSGFFQIKSIEILILKREISGSHTISDQSLLLSTTVFNDEAWLSNEASCIAFKFIYTV